MDLYANAPDFGAQPVRPVNPLIGKRVEIPVHTDAWMRGDRYGEIVSATPQDRITVKLDKSGRKVEMHVDSVHQFV